MKLSALALSAAVSSAASATFVSYVVTVSSTTSGGVALDVYTLWARFNGPTDTVINVFNFNRTDGSAGDMFYHKDNSDYSGGVLGKQYGTWAPTLTGSATLNRPFDSYLTIGGLPTATNTSNADPSWTNAAAAGWSRHRPHQVGVRCTDIQKDGGWRGEGGGGHRRGRRPADARGIHGHKRLPSTP